MPIMSKTDSFFIVFILIVWGIGGFPVALCAQGAAGVLPETHLVEVGKGYSQTSVNTAVFRNNSLVTQGDEQYISYYDAEGFLTLGKRNLHAGQWTLHRTQYKGNVKDAHNVISMMLDGDGYIHVAFDHHGQPHLSLTQPPFPSPVSQHPCLQRFLLSQTPHNKPYTNLLL